MTDVAPSIQYQFDDEETENDEALALELQRQEDAAALPLARTQSVYEQQLERLKKKSYSGAHYGIGHEVRPCFIYTMMVVCTFIMLLELWVNNNREGEPFDDFVTNPLFGPTSDTLIFLGAKRSDLIVEGDWWRLFSPLLLHGGLLHLAFNMLFLYSFGTGLEAEFGHTRVAYIYFSSGFFGILCSAILNPTLVSVGASSACYGLIGAAWADFWLNFGFYKASNWKSWLCQLTFGTILNICLGLIPTLDNFAHIGGFVAGFITGLTVLTLPRYDYFLEAKPEHCYQIILKALAALTTPLGIIICLIVLYEGVDTDQYCPWCHYLTCVPSPWWLCEVSCDEGFEINLETDGSASIVCPRDIGLISVPAPIPELSGDEDAQYDFCIDNCLDT